MVSLQAHVPDGDLGEELGHRFEHPEPGPQHGYCDERLGQPGPGRSGQWCLDLHLRGLGMLRVASRHSTRANRLASSRNRGGGVPRSRSAVSIDWARGWSTT